jgi:hypothetical protein
MSRIDAAAANDLSASHQPGPAFIVRFGDHELKVAVAAGDAL